VDSVENIILLLMGNINLKFFSAREFIGGHQQILEQLGGSATHREHLLVSIMHGTHRRASENI
jgi:hypothetical protein